MEKLLITPLITPGGIPTEEQLNHAGMNGNIIIDGSEGSKESIKLHAGASENFHRACRELVGLVSKKAQGLLVGGTTGEGVGLGLLQWQTLMQSVIQSCPSHVRIMAGILGREDMIREQVAVAHGLSCNEFVLGLNHLGDNQQRYNILRSALGTNDKIWLYNMPTFSPASLDFIRSCMSDIRVQGIKDSSLGTDVMRIRELLRLQEERPDFQVLVGNESVYATLPGDDFARVGGLVSGNSNVKAYLMYDFTQDPRAYEDMRQKLHKEIASLASGRRDGAHREISAHILGLKIQSQAQDILSPGQVYLYADRERLFEPNQY